MYPEKIIGAAISTSAVAMATSSIKVVDDLLPAFLHELNSACPDPNRETTTIITTALTNSETTGNVIPAASGEILNSDNALQCSKHEKEPWKFNFETCESYMAWNKHDPNPNYSGYIQVAQSHFSSTTVRAFAMGKTTPVRGRGQQDEILQPVERFKEYNPYFSIPNLGIGDFDENKRYNMFEHITNLGALSFFYLEMNDLVTARVYFVRALDCVAQNTAEQRIPLVYIESMMHVLGLLSLYASEKEKKLKGEKENTENFSKHTYFGSFQWAYRKIHPFDTLSKKGKAGVYGMKHFYGKMVKMDVDEMLGIIKTAVILDPMYYEWHYCLQASLRSKRRLHSYHHFQPNPLPSDEERDAICTANQLETNHPRCMLAEVLYLADIIKVHFVQDRSSDSIHHKKWDSLYYKNMTFETVESVVQFIRDQVGKILVLSPTSVHTNTAVADIFTVLLPHKFRDFNFAQECLERALEFHPWSSKANHKMGTLLLNRGKQETICHARVCSYFERSVTKDETNFPSLCALIQVLMKQLPVNMNLILSFIDRKLTLNFWDPIQIAGLKYLKGIAFYTGKKWKESIDAFKDAYELHPGSLTFEDLPYQHRRYFWPEHSILILTHMLEQWKKIKRRTVNPNRKQFIGVLIARTIESIECEKKYQASVQINKQRLKTYRDRELFPSVIMPNKIVESRSCQAV